MEEINNTWEQPEDLEIQATAVDCENGNDGKVSGSRYGKFKDADSLYSAYNELQSEFTRKCQRLSELESMALDNVSNNTSNIDTPEEKTISWQDSVSDFVKNHKHAMLYSKDITSELLKDNTLTKDKKGLEIAYSRVIESKFQPKDEMVKDEAFLNEYILNNEDIKKRIINDYLKTMNRAPTVLGEKSTAVTLTPRTKASDLNEARKIVENMLKY